MSRTKKYNIGDKTRTKQGYEIEIIERIKINELKVNFTYNNYECICNYDSFTSGSLKNPYHPTLFAVGYLGDGKYTLSGDKNGRSPEYICWSSMLRRCYSEYTKEKQKTYENCTVSEEWHNFQNFAEWYNDNYPKIDGIAFELDKDLLQTNVENKIYSKETCIFLPSNVNKFLTNKKITNTSGYAGVEYTSTMNRWSARIKDFKTGKRISLGSTIYEEKVAELSIRYDNYRKENINNVISYLDSLNYIKKDMLKIIKEGLMNSV